MSFTKSPQNINNTNNTNKFNYIDYINWDRKEIYDKFLGYTFSVTSEITVTNFRAATKKAGYKFYPSICYAIGKTVNSDHNYRFARVGGKPGYYDFLNLHYNLLRDDGSHLFTHAVTPFRESFPDFYLDFQRDKASAASCGRLYNYDAPRPDSVHVSVSRNIVHTSISMSKPAEFSSYNKPDTPFIPFVIVGKLYEKNGETVLPVTVEFHHCVNDGYHAERFFLTLEAVCEKTAGNLSLT